MNRKKHLFLATFKGLRIYQGTRIHLFWSEEYDVTVNDNASTVFEHFRETTSLIILTRRAFTADPYEVRVRNPGPLKLSQPRFHSLQRRHPKELPHICHLQVRFLFRRNFRRSQAVESEAISRNADFLDLLDQAFCRRKRPELRRSHRLHRPLVEEPAENGIVTRIRGNTCTIRDPKAIREAFGGGFAYVEETLG